LTTEERGGKGEEGRRFLSLKPSNRQL